MNFFEHQSVARRATRWLVVMMALAVFGMSLSLYFLLLWISYTGSGALQLSFSWWQPEFFWATFLGTGGLVTIASFSRTMLLRGGGRVVAEMLGGRLISSSTTDLYEKRLVNVVEEMAIASSVPMPLVFVLEKETAINAFASGFSASDAALTVTLGALQKLSRDELQGVVAHEFSHILNGDMRLNMRLMGAVFGVMCIAVAGRMIADTLGRSGTRSENPRRARDFNMLGIGLIVIGAVGEFCGKVIQAAVSRQREYLADASAVQFTRNPAGLSGALKKIGGLSRGSTIDSSRANEASHFFFGDPHRAGLSALFSSHPPLKKRIKRLDPNFDGAFEEISPYYMACPQTSLELLHTGLVPSERRAWPDLTVRRPHFDIEDARSVMQSLSPELQNAARDPFPAAAGVCALLLRTSESETNQKQMALLSKTLGDRFAQDASTLARSFEALTRSQKLAWIRLAAPSLRQMSPRQRAHFDVLVNGLALADGQIDVFEFIVTQTLLRRMLRPGEAERISRRALVKTTKALEDECVLLFSLAANVTASDITTQTKAFEEACRAAGLPKQRQPLQWNKNLIGGFPQALSNIRHSIPKVRETILEACLSAMIVNGKLSLEESELLAAFGDALACPLPVLLQLERKLDASFGE